MVKPQWSIREYQEGDEEQARELRGMVLSGSKDSQWWNWMYRNGPDGPAIIWLAETKQKIIGLNARIPLRMKIGNQTRKGTLPFDLMTHLEYQHQGILTALSTKAAETAVKNGISLTYNTATLQVFPVYDRMKVPYSHFSICEPPLLVKIVNWGKVLKSRFGIPPFAGKLFGFAWDGMIYRCSALKNANIEVEQTSSFDKSIDEFWLKASEIKKIMVIRDMKYLNWRYIENPGNEYNIFVAKRQKEIIGYIVLKSIRDVLTTGYIIDLLTLPREDMITEVLITKAIGYFQEEGVDIISCLMLKDTPYYRTLRKRGFIRRHSRLSLGARLYDQNISGEFVSNPSNWYYMWGDKDNI